jgi:Tol biopolymer transport system component/DNA-binding winged helix-turn-helix (wHTH) protein
MPKQNKHYQFGEFLLIPEENLLTYQNEPVKIPLKAFELLLFFVENSNQVIDKETLLRKVWGETFVEEANLTVHISTLRKILARESEKPVKIETFPKRGYRFVAEIREIEENNAVEARTQNRADAVGPEKLSKPVQTGQKQWLVSILVLAVILIGAGFFWSSWFRKPSLASLKFNRIPGTEKSVDIAISPNGEYLAHAVSNAGKRSLRLLHLGTSSSVELMSPADVTFHGMSFSPDGNFVYYALKEKEGTNLYKIPILGGTERVKVLNDVPGRFSLSPDAKQVALTREVKGQMVLTIANTDGSGERILATSQSPQSYSSNLAWSPDGKIIACMKGTGVREKAVEVVAVEVETGQEKPITDMKWPGNDGLVWLPDGSGLLVASEEKPAMPIQIWFVPYPSGEAYPVTADLNSYGSIGITADGKTILAGKFSNNTSLWLASDDGVSPPKPITSERYHSFNFVRWSRDNRIVFSSSARGERDVWIVDADGGNPKQLTVNTGYNGMPAVSADNRFIIFISDRVEAGNFNLWKMNIDGTNQVQLTRGKGELRPVPSPDGKWVVYTAGRMDSAMTQRTIWKVPLEGGEPVQIVSKPSYGADVSPDGKFIATWYKPDESTPFKVAIISIDGGEPVKFLDILPTSTIHWTPDGSAISYIKTVEGVSNIWNQPTSGEPPKQVTQFTSERISDFDWSADGRLVCARNYTERDVVLISNFR